MNKVFQNNSRIDLDNFYHLISDSDSGIILIFSEVRERINKKTEEMEDYIYEDKWYFTRIKQALSKYVDLTQNGCKTIEEILIKTDKIDKLLEKLDKTFMQFN